MRNKQKRRKRRRRNSKEAIFLLGDRERNETRKRANKS